MTLSSDRDEQQLPLEEPVSSDTADELPSTLVVEEAQQPSDGVEANPPIAIEDLTLAEMFGQVLRAPAHTLRAFQQVLSSPVESENREVGGFSERKSIARRPVQKSPTRA